MGEMSQVASSGTSSDLMRYLSEQDGGQSVCWIPRAWTKLRAEESRVGQGAKVL